MIANKVEGRIENFIPFHEYLSQIKNPAERALEEARIKKAVRWYD